MDGVSSEVFRIPLGSQDPKTNNPGGAFIIGTLIILIILNTLQYV